LPLTEDSMAKKILVIDDEPSILESLSGILSDEGFEPICAASAEEGLKIIEDDSVDLVLLDIWMPGMDGLEALRRIKKLHDSLPVIMISGHGTIETAVQATKIGAFDFIEKPPSYEKIMVAINNGLRLSQLTEENLILRQKTASKPRLTGNSPAIRQLRAQIERVAPTEAWVLIRGEHGTGKELVAQAIHALSRAAQKPMIELNCAAIPEELIESELFGHERGAFTGATAPKQGKFDQANGGLLFLDEIGDMSLKTQAKILRILQEQKFERVGGAKTISVHVRVLAATNKNLEEEIREGRFRADLFYRLNVVPIRVPSLRERMADLDLLVEDFTAEFAHKGFGGKSFAPEAIKVMANHHWPGNIRELRNFLERVVIMSSESVVSKESVLQFLQPFTAGQEKPTFGSSELYAGLNFKEAKKAFERDFIQVRLQENRGNISQTAEQIGLERSHLHKKMKSLGDEED
jgi:two-component system, NtrC family, nitrogen regulation response regulator NtrX